MEAFKRGLYDFRIEDDPGRWANDYEFPAARTGGLIREALETRTPKSMQAFVFNTRREIFADRRVREALIGLLDFEWMNAKLFHSAYARTGSFFEGSVLSARGVPANIAERDLLAPFIPEVRKDVLDGTYQPPRSDGSGGDRTQLRRAFALLAEAGWIFRDGRLVRKSDGQAFAFEILVSRREDERVATIYSTMLSRAGIAASVRMVEVGQFEARRQQYDFDMVPVTWQQSLSPGNEQYFYWGSASADQPATRNYMGMKSAAADAMIDALLRARTLAELTAAREHSTGCSCRASTSSRSIICRSNGSRAGRASSGPPRCQIRARCQKCGGSSGCSNECDCAGHCARHAVPAQRRRAPGGPCNPRH